MEIIDKSGTPRSDEEIRDAIRAIEKEFPNLWKLPIPNLVIHFPTIREALIELLIRRKKHEDNHSQRGEEAGS
jgi:hypothetical protein